MDPLFTSQETATFYQATRYAPIEDVIVTEDRVSRYE
jgi:hypothetical protein